MSDLNNFIMIEDSKIHEQEQRFKDQWGTESDAIDEESPNMEAFGFGTTEVEMDERLEQLDNGHWISSGQHGTHHHGRVKVCQWRVVETAEVELAYTVHENDTSNTSRHRDTQHGECHDSPKRTNEDVNVHKESTLKNERW